MEAMRSHSEIAIRQVFMKDGERRKTGLHPALHHHYKLIYSLLTKMQLVGNPHKLDVI
jgi:hypothetical protein